MSEPCPNSKKFSKTNLAGKIIGYAYKCDFVCQQCRGEGLVVDCLDCDGCGLRKGGVRCNTCNCYGKIPASFIKKAAASA
jgi:hypothetical protein